MEDDSIGQGEHAQGAVLRTEESEAVLPERLQRAEGPAEPLANEHAGRFGGFRPGDGFFVVINMPAEAAYGDGEVGIFGNGIRGDPSGGFDGFSAPGTQCAGDYGDAV